MRSPYTKPPKRDDRIPIGPGDVISVNGPIRAFPIRGGLAIEKAEHIHGKWLFAAVRGTGFSLGFIHKLLGDSFGQIEGCFGLHRFSMGLVKSDAAERNAPLHIPRKYGKHASYVLVSWFFKRVVCQLYCLTKKLFMVHAGIIGYFRGYGHSYFPMICDSSFYFCPNLPLNATQQN